MRTAHPHTARRAARLTVATVAGALSAVAVVLAAGGSPQSSGGMSPAMALRATGPLAIDNSREGSAVLTAAGMAPGQSQTGLVDIKNASGMDATFALAQSHVTGPALAGSLNLAVVDCGAFAGTTAPTCDAGDPQVYSGALNGLTSRALGTYAGGATHRYRFSVVFPNGTAAHDNALQNAVSSVQFDWSAEAPEPTTTTQPPVTTVPPVTTTPPTTTTGNGGGTLNPSGSGNGRPKYTLGLPGNSSDASRLSFMAICDRACTLTVGGTLSVQGTRRAYRLRSVTQRLKPGVRFTIRVPFSATARRALAKALKQGKRGTAKLTVTIRNGSASSTSRRTIVIRRKKR